MAEKDKDTNVYYKPVDQQQDQGYLGRYSGMVDSPGMLAAVNRGMARTAYLTRDTHKPWDLYSSRSKAVTTTTTNNKRIK
jgi:hypothetical protein